MTIKIPNDLMKVFFDKKSQSYKLFSLDGEEIYGVIEVDVLTAEQSLPKASVTLLVDVVNELPTSK